MQEDCHTENKCRELSIMCGVEVFVWTRDKATGRVIYAWDSEGLKFIENLK